jgi:hypothetical protein
MTLREQDRPYTREQAEELERALEAQYLADKRNPPPAHEYAAWRRTRRTAAERRLGRPDQRQT